MNQQNLFVIAGPNGAGKTTFAKEFLPRFAKCDEFLNMDLIAGGLSPFDARSAAIEAGRIMIARLHLFLERRKSFAFETTLAGRNHARLLKYAKSRGYHMSLYYLTLPTVNLALQRIKDRASRGGHDVPEMDVRRRFQRSLSNFFKIYQPIVDEWLVFDNSEREPLLIARQAEGRFKVWDLELWESIQVQRENNV